MPSSVQPTIRALQEVQEASGRYQTRDTRLVTIYKAKESAGTQTKQVPKITFWYLGTKTVAS